MKSLVLFPYRFALHLLFLLFCLLCSSVSFAAVCPVSPTQYADVTIPDPKPAPAPGEWPADMSKIMDYISANNITTSRDFLSHMPLHMKKHYSFIKNTGGLHTASLESPGLLVWGSDARFMMNMSSKAGSPLYDVVDMAFLQADGDWEFRSLDFSGSTPVLSPDAGDNGKCRECHGQGASDGVGPLRPLLGNYLFWTGFFSNSNDAAGEAVTAEEKPVLDRIKNGGHNMDRFHSILFGDYLYAEVGVANMLPDHAYGPGLTIFNTEMAAAATESIHKRLSRSGNYRGLREEMLALSYCDGRQLSSSDKQTILDLVESKGGSPRSFISYNSWAGVYQAMGLDPRHELPLHIKTKDTPTIMEADMNWSTGVSPLRETIDFLILMELAEENADVAAMLANNPSSYPMTGGCRFNSLQEHFDHKMYAMYTLYGNARQLARQSYYDIDYHRIHASMDYIQAPLCSLLAANIGPGTIGNGNTVLPIAKTTGPYQAQVGVDIAFNSDQSSGGNSRVIAYRWDFGDGSRSELANPTHRYSTSGSFNVSLTVTNENNQSATTTTTATISRTRSNTLTNGVPVTGLSANKGSYSKYTLSVPAGASNLQIKINGSSGDMDMYVKHGTEPSDSDHDCRPYFSHSNEVCEFPNPQPGTWHINLFAFTDVTNLTLLASYDEGGPGNQAPQADAGGPYSGKSTQGIAFDGSASSDPDGTINDYAWTFGDGAVGAGIRPTHVYSNAGTYTVTLTVTDDGGKKATASTTVTVTSSAITLGNGVPINDISGGADEQLFYFIHVHGANPSNLQISLSGDTATTDLYVKHGSMPSLSDFDCGGVANTQCSFSTPAHGPYYIMIHGREAFSAVTLTGRFDEGNRNRRHTVMLHNHSQHGNYLAGGPASGRSGLSLYVWDEDVGTGGSQCNGSCAVTWPPLTVASPNDISAPAGVGNLGTIIRDDGSLQVTLEGRPVYFYDQDAVAADINGHGVAGTWWLAKVADPNPTNEYGLVDACGAGRSPSSDIYLTLGEAYCTNDAQNGAQSNFKYSPTAADVGRDLLITIGHGDGIAGLTANQDFNAYATEADYRNNPGVVFGSFGLDPLNRRLTYNRVIIPNVKAEKDVWISLNAGSNGFSQVAVKVERIIPVDVANLPDACAGGSPPITDQYVTLGEAVCGKSSPGTGHYTHFIYRPTAAQAGKSFILETAHGTGQANMTVNQHYSSAPTSGGVAFAHEEHLADRPDLVFSSFRDAVEQRVVYPNATAGQDIFVVIPPGPSGFSEFTFRIRLAP